MGKHRDWSRIREDYQKSGLNYPALAEKYGISISTLKKAAARQKWSVDRAGERIEAALRKIEKMEPEPEPEKEMEPEPSEETAEEMEPDQKMEPEPETNIIPLYPDRVLPAEDDAARFRRLVDELMNRVEDAICQMDVTQPGSVKLMTGALKDLRSLKGLDKTPLDIEEQRARIEKLKSEAAIREVTQEPVVIRFVDLEGAET